MHDNVPDILELFQNSSDKSLKTCSEVRGTASASCFLFLYPSPHPLYWWASQFIILLSQSLYPFWHPASFPVNKPLVYRLAMLQVLQLFFCLLHHDEVTRCCMFPLVQHYTEMTNNTFNLSDSTALVTLNTCTAFTFEWVAPYWGISGLNVL